MGDEIWLRESGLIPEAQIELARSVAIESHVDLLRAVAKLGLVSEVLLAKTLAESSAARFVEEKQLTIDASRLQYLDAEYLRQRRIAPVTVDDGEGYILTSNPLDPTFRQDVEFALDEKILVAVATHAVVDELIAQAFPDDSDDDAVLGSLSGSDEFDDLRVLASNAPVVRSVQRLISYAIESRASDIHFEAIDTGLSVRYRVDGLMTEVERTPFETREAIVSRIKIMAGLDIAERRLPQDGRMKVAVHGKDVDFRVATTPTVNGESVVLRVLDRQQVAIDLCSLGFDDDARSQVRSSLSRPYGLLLCSGPTGSGKSTTLYAALKELNTRERKILTVEDPVEYTIDGVNQTNVRPQIGYTFANALRAFLRQDPDVLMVGEIRDRETAEVAIQAALTGHLLLSTIHTNSAAGAITRLLDMGLDDFLLTSTLNLIIGQRLVRKLCVVCREPYLLAREFADRLGVAELEGSTFYHPCGCTSCGGKGYAGRTSIIETLVVSPEIQRLILARADARAIEEAAVASGMKTMFADGLGKAAVGITTIEEVLRVTRLS